MKKKYLNLLFDNTLSVAKNPFNIALISIIGIFFTTLNLYSDYNYLPQSPSDTHHYISKAFQIINLSKENYIHGLDHNLFGQDFTRSFNLYFAIIGKFLNNSYASVISINFFYFTISLLPIIKFLNFYFEDKNKTSFILLLLIFLPLFQGIWTPISFYSLLYDSTVFYISLASFFSLFLVFLDPYNKSNYLMAGFYFGFLFWTRGNSFLYVLILGFPFLVSLILQIKNKEIQIKKIKFYLILFFSIFFFFLFFKLFYSADLIKSYYSPHSSQKYSIINFINENSLKIFLLEYLNMLLNNPTRFFQDFVTGGENYYLKIQWLYGERNNLLIYDDKRLAFVFYFKLFLSFFSHLIPFLLYFFRNKFFKEKILRKLISLAFFIYLIFLIYMSYITMWSIYGILNPHLTSYILVPYILFFLVFFIKLMKFIPIRFINNFSLIIILIILFTSNFFITKKSFENRKDIITERSDNYNNSLQRITTSKDIESFSKNLNLFTNFNDVVFIWYGYSYNPMFINFFRAKNNLKNINDFTPTENLHFLLFQITQSYQDKNLCYEKVDKVFKKYSYFILPVYLHDLNLNNTGAKNCLTEIYEIMSNNYKFEVVKQFFGQRDLVLLKKVNLNQVTQNEYKIMPIDKDWHTKKFYKPLIYKNYLYSEMPTNLLYLNKKKNLAFNLNKPHFTEYDVADPAYNKVIFKSEVEINSFEIISDDTKEMLERLPQKLILNCENKKIEINFKINPKNFSRNNGYKLKLKEPLNCSDVIISFTSGKKEQSFVRYIIRDVKDSNDRSLSDKILSISTFKNKSKYLPQ